MLEYYLGQSQSQNSPILLAISAFKAQMRKDSARHARVTGQYPPARACSQVNSFYLRIEGQHTKREI